MNLIIDILTGIGGSFIALWTFLWTYMRWQRIVHGKEAGRPIKNIWWVLLCVGAIFLIASLVVFMETK